MRAQAVAGLARLSVSDRVGQDDEIACGVEQLPWPEERARELVAQERLPGSAGAVHDQHSVPHYAHRIAGRRPDRRVVQSQLGKRLAALKAYILDVEVALCGLRVAGCR